MLASNVFKGIDNPLARVGCKCVLFGVEALKTGICMVLLLVRQPWFSLREILISTVLHFPSSPWKIPTQFTRSGNNF